MVVEVLLRGNRREGAGSARHGDESTVGWYVGGVDCAFEWVFGVVVVEVGVEVEVEVEDVVLW